MRNNYIPTGPLAAQITVDTAPDVHPYDKETAMQPSPAQLAALTPLTGVSTDSGAWVITRSTVMVLPDAYPAVPGYAANPWDMAYALNYPFTWGLIVSLGVWLYSDAPGARERCPIKRHAPALAYWWAGATLHDPQSHIWGKELGLVDDWVSIGYTPGVRGCQFASGGGEPLVNFDLAMAYLKAQGAIWLRTYNGRWDIDTPDDAYDDGTLYPAIPGFETMPVAVRGLLDNILYNWGQANLSASNAQDTDTPVTPA